MMTRPYVPILIAVLATTPLGCSFYYSSESSAKSLASPITSSTSSSSDDDEGKTTYRDDIRDYTYAYVVAGHGLDTYPQGLGEIARRHGITNWEEDDATYVAIGAGLARAGLSAGEAESFERRLAGSDRAKATLIRRGYDGHDGQPTA